MIGPDHAACRLPIQDAHLAAYMQHVNPVQVRDEVRQNFDPQRGGWGKQSLDSELASPQEEAKRRRIGGGGGYFSEGSQRTLRRRAEDDDENPRFKGRRRDSDDEDDR